MRSLSSASPRDGGRGGADAEDKNAAEGIRGVAAGGGKGESFPKLEGRC